MVEISVEFASRTSDGDVSTVHLHRDAIRNVELSFRFYESHLVVFYTSQRKVLCCCCCCCRKEKEREESAEVSTQRDVKQRAAPTTLVRAKKQTPPPPRTKRFGSTEAPPSPFFGPLKIGPKNGPNLLRHRRATTHSRPIARARTHATAFGITQSIKFDAFRIRSLARTRPVLPRASGFCPV